MTVLENLIKQMESGQTKVAGASSLAPAPVAPAVADQLQSALTKAATAPVGAPTTPAETPVDALMASAMKLASAEQQVNLEEARMLGAAFGDGLLAKMAAAEKTAAQLPAAVLQSAAPIQPIAAMQPDALKQAAHAGYVAAQDPEAEKLASQLGQIPEEDLRRRAADAGYQGTMAKVAKDYDAGHDSTLQEVANGLAGEFYKGAEETMEMLRRAAAQPAAPQ